MTVLLYRLRRAIPSILIILAAGTIFAAGQGCPSSGFISAAPVPADSYPATVASADFNGDGKADLTTANYLSSTIAVSFGNGDGTFSDPVLFANPGNPFSLAARDINGDGHPDIVSGNAGSNDLTIWLGNGQGGFANVGNLPVGATPFAVYVTDLNGDARPDLLSANFGSNDISVLLGNGSGGFSAAMSIPTGATPTSAAFADLDLNGTIDVVVANNAAHTFSVLFGNGNGTFASPIPYSMNQFPQSVAVGDLNEDGLTDVVSANSGSNSVSVRLNLGGGNFGASMDFAAGSMPYGIATGDLNSDGSTDLVTTNFFGNTVSVLLGLGNGRFDPAMSFPVGAEPSSVIITDLNGDSFSDLATSNTGSNNVSILLNSCVPSTNTPPTIEASPVTKQKGSAASRVAIATVTDAEDPESDLTITINSNGSATLNGVTVSAITINEQGIVEAEVTAGCDASEAAFTLQVTDLGGLSAETALTVSVSRSNAPQLNVRSAISLFPHNGRMRTISMDDMLASVSDDCDADLSSDIVVEQVTSDEFDKTNGSIVIGDDCRSVSLRADRDNKGDGRVYSVRLRVTDSDDNTAAAEFKVTIPVTPNSGPAIEGAALLTVNGSCP